jgi:hypothetical protein
MVNILINTTFKYSSFTENWKKTILFAM